MPTAWAPTTGRVASKVARAPELPRARGACDPELGPVALASRASRARSSLAWRRSGAPEQAVGGHAAVLQQHLGGVGGADAELPLLLALAQARGAGRDHEAGLAAVAEGRVDGGHDHVQAGDAAVGDEDLLAVQDPVVAVAHGPGAEAGDVGPGARLGDRERAHLGLGRGAEQLGGPAGHLLGGAAGHQGDQRQPAAEDAEGDAGTAPAELLDQQRLEDAGLVLADHAVEVHAVEADVGRLGQDRPGEVLGLVVVGRDRPDLPLGELAGPFLGGHLVFGEREADHGQILSRNCCYRSVTY